MVNTLVQYFIQHDHLDLPGIGTLKWVKQDAFWQDNQLIAPIESIVLDPIDNKPSKQFYIYLGDELAVSSEQAVLKYEQLLKNFIDDTAGQMVLGNLGVIQKKENKYDWTSNYDASIFFKNITLSSDTILQSEAYWELESNNADKWWIWALAISIVSIGLIYFKLS
jgi:hypothetical protein